MSIIYKITNTINGKLYIGKTNFSLQRRFNQHLSDSKKEICKERPLYRAISKYGIENFTIEMIEKTTVEMSSEREIFWINHYEAYDFGYNATKGGEGLSLIDHKLVIETYNNCKSVKNTAKICNCDTSSVYLILKSSDISCPRPSGDNSVHSLITSEDVKKIRELYIPKTFGKRKIAKKLNLPLDAVNGVIRGDNWKSV